MPTMPSNEEFRAKARTSLTGLWGTCAGHIFLIFLICAIPLWVLDQIEQLATLASWAVTGALTLGYVTYFMDVARGNRPSFGQFFSGFQQFGPAFLLYLLISIFTVLWSLLLIVPGIIAWYRYSMAFFILRDDPDVGAMEAIRRSKSMMDGYKGQLFLLYLSFIGWFLLTLLTCGIGTLWLYPYYMTAKAHFYQALKERRETFTGALRPAAPYIGQ
ncbi:DUF975 family protein [Paenibacillus cymbidii]|uniref:DUF975 family protein n=1 Tax=Paenibacillus cymbidii TaxID=1639034 RepID=UPI001F1D1F83|nr:DUF975 family protein [Paenibacillus cymbidii]